MRIFNSKVFWLYRKAPFAYKLYTLIRYILCPFDEIEKYVSRQGRIMDCGCGHGIFANMLAVKSDKRYVIGVDVMKEKIRVANLTIFDRKNIEFNVMDLKDVQDIESLECITFTDALHYMNFNEKEKLLKYIYDKLRPEAMLVIKTIQEKPYWKYKWTLLYLATVDKAMHNGFRGNSFFLKKNEFSALLNKTGFDVEFKKLDRWYVYPHCLYICKKPIKR